MIAALGQHLQGHVLRHAVFLDEPAQEGVFGLAGSREAHFDLLEADLDEHIVKFQLFFQAHGHDQALVAVAQIHAAPGGRFFDVVLLRPAEDVAGFDRRRIIPYCVLGCVHHNKNLLQGPAPRKEVNKNRPPKAISPLRDGNKYKFAVPAVPLSLPPRKRNGRPLCTIGPAGGESRLHDNGQVPSAPTAKTPSARLLRGQ